MYGNRVFGFHQYNDTTSGKILYSKTFDNMDKWNYLCSIYNQSSMVIPMDISDIKTPNWKNKVHKKFVFAVTSPDKTFMCQECGEQSQWTHKIKLGGCKKDCKREEFCIKCALVITMEMHPDLLGEQARYMRRCYPCGIRSQFIRVDGRYLLSNECFSAELVKSINSSIPNRTIEM